MATLLIKNGRLVDPASKIDGKRDILISNGQVIKVAQKIANTKGAKVIDAKGMLVLPGLIDMHVHLRDPGQPEKETIATGTRAAALGGFTTICPMANTDPPVDTPAVVKYVKEKALISGVVNVLPIGAVTKGLLGESITEMGLMLEAGAIAFSDDGQPIVRADVMRRALEYASQFNVPIITHCENRELAEGGSMNESELSTKIGLPGVPALAEEIMVARDVILAEQYGRVHIAHVSTAKSVELVRQAKRRGIQVTCETCPHYFSLTEESVKEYDTNAKVNPPLRTSQDVKAIIKGLKDGTIDVIATDHAPHDIESKNVEFNQAASGLVGLETALALVLTKLVETKQLKLKEAIAKLTVNPAKILGLNKGSLKVGFDADLIIVDQDKSFVVDPTTFASKSKNSPFKGWPLNGKVSYTIVSGKVVVKNGKLV